MRRSDREITDYNKMLEILGGCDCCRIAINTDSAPYILPLNFGFSGESGALTLYFHSANEGRKLELLKKNPTVGFEADRSHSLIEGEKACDYSFRYQSIIGTGRVEILADYNEKLDALKAIMSHYSSRTAWSFDEKAVSAVTVLKLTVSEWSCKEH